MVQEPEAPKNAGPRGGQRRRRPNNNNRGPRPAANQKANEQGGN